MIKCQVIENFNLEEFYKLSNIVRAGGRNDKGKLYVGDTFECDEDMVKYLSGGNEQKKVVVKIIEIKPKKQKKH